MISKIKNISLGLGKCLRVKQVSPVCSLANQKDIRSYRGIYWFSILIKVMNEISITGVLEERKSVLRVASGRLGGGNASGVVAQMLQPERELVLRMKTKKDVHSARSFINLEGFEWIVEKKLVSD